MIVSEAVTKFDTEILDHLDRDLEVPTVTEAACQGDVSIRRIGTAVATTPVPRSGVAVVRGENGGNTHSLHGDGPICWDIAPDRTEDLVLGTLTVADGSIAVLAHPEHGF